MLQNKGPQRLEEDEVRHHCWCTFRLLQASPGRAHSSWSSSRAVDLKDSQNILFNTPAAFSLPGNNISRPCLGLWGIHKSEWEDCHDSRPPGSFLGPGRSLWVPYPLIYFSLPRAESAGNTTKSQTNSPFFPINFGFCRKLEDCHRVTLQRFFFFNEVLEQLYRYLQLLLENPSS